MAEKKLKIACLLQPHYDYLCASIIEGLNLLGHDCIGLENSNYCKKISKNEFKRFSAKCDLLIIFSGNLVDIGLLGDIKADRVVFVDGTDHPEIAAVPNISINHVFKRELLLATRRKFGDSISPLSFAIERRYLNAVDAIKCIDVSFIGSMSNFMRSSVKEFLLCKENLVCFAGGTAEIAYDGVAGMPLSTPKYYNLLAQSSASIDIPGRGWDCARTWEIVAAKAALIKFRPEIIYPSALIEGDHFLGFNTLDELDGILNSLINKPKEISDMAARCYQYALAHHTTLARAQYFLSEIYSREISTVSLENLKVYDFNATHYFIRRHGRRFLRRSSNMLKETLNK